MSSALNLIPSLYHGGRAAVTATAAVATATPLPTATKLTPSDHFLTRHPHVPWPEGCLDEGARPFDRVNLVFVRTTRDRKKGPQHRPSFACIPRNPIKRLHLQLFLARNRNHV